ncbi:unnamed protein product [Effrenium voratum]|nr:unnamed protein product [Effrenium voratum]
MDVKSTKQALDGIQVTAVASLKKVASKQLHPLAALRFKLFLTVVLYAASFTAVAVLQSSFQETLQLEQFEINNVTSGTMMFSLKDCNMDVQLKDGNSIVLIETTMDQGGERRLHVKWNATSDVLKVNCVGPAALHGEAVTVVVQVGREIHFHLVDLIFEPGGRSLFRSATSVDLGDNFSVTGDDGILQIYPSKIGSMSVQMDSGFIFLYEVDFDEASFVLGGEVDVYSWQDTYQRGMNVNLQTGDGENVTAGLCLSDTAGRPTLQLPTSDDFDSSFSLGSSENPRILNVTRGNALSRLFLTHGVWRSQRNCGNTWDSVVKVGARLDDKFAAWSTEVSQSGTELMNLWLLGGSLGSEIQSVTSSGFWIFSQFGDALMWFPVGLWNIFTLGIFSPRTAREVFLVKDSLCLAKRDRITAGATTCRARNSTEEALHTQVLENCAQAWRNSLPESLNLTNARNGRIYYVLREFRRGGSMFPSLADGAVSMLSATTSAFVKLVAGPQSLRGVPGLLFVIIMILLAVAGGVFACLLVASLYKMQKRRYLKARGALDCKLMQNEVLRSMLHMETRSNLLMTLVRCLILRSPSGKASVTILKAVELCFGHFIVTQLLITPLVLIAVLNVSNIAELRAMCNFNEWMEGACLNIRHRRLSNIILVAAMVMNSIFFLTTLLEYFTRHGLDVAEESGKCPTAYRAAMTIRGSLPYRTFLTTSLLFSLFFFCAYFITVTIFVLLGTLLKPERLAPILLSIAGAVVVAQQVTQKFDEMVEKAKTMAAEWAATSANKALDFAKGAIGEKVEGMASSIMNTPFAQQALARTGVDADDFSAEKVSAMAGNLMTSAAQEAVAEAANAKNFNSEAVMSRMRQATQNAAATAVGQAQGMVMARAQQAAMLAAASAAGQVEGVAGSAMTSATKEAMAKLGLDAESLNEDVMARAQQAAMLAAASAAGQVEGVAGSAMTSATNEAMTKSGLDAESLNEDVMARAQKAAMLAAASAAGQVEGVAGSALTSATKEAMAKSGLDAESLNEDVMARAQHAAASAAGQVEGVACSAMTSATKEAMAKSGIDADSCNEDVMAMAQQAAMLAAASAGQVEQDRGDDTRLKKKKATTRKKAAPRPKGAAKALGGPHAGDTATLEAFLSEPGDSVSGMDQHSVFPHMPMAGSDAREAVEPAGDVILSFAKKELPAPPSTSTGASIAGMAQAATLNDAGILHRAIDINLTCSENWERFGNAGGAHNGLLKSLNTVVGPAMEDMEAALGSIEDAMSEEGSEESLDLENVLVMMGLSKGQTPCNPRRMRWPRSSSDPTSRAFVKQRGYVQLLSHATPCQALA